MRGAIVLESESKGVQKGQTRTDGVAQKTGTGGAKQWVNGWANQRSSNWQSTRSRTLKRQLVPILKWRESLRMLEFYSHEEQTQVVASELSKLSVGQALILVSGVGVAKVQIPYQSPPFANAPKTHASRLASFRELQANWTSSIESVLEERRLVVDRFLSQIRGDRQEQDAVPAQENSGLLGI